MEATAQPAAAPSRSAGSDRHPFVTARAWPNATISEAFEAWEPKHVQDLVQGPGVVKGAYYHAVTSGIPEAFLGSGTIMAYYTGRDLPGLLAFLNSKELADAVEEGGQWFGNFHPTDFEDLTGNIYEVASVVRAGDEPVPDDVPFVFWQRFEVPEGDVSDFDAWSAEHVAALAAAPGILRARTFTAVREGSPIAIYYSRGNRLVAAEAASLDAVLSPPVVAAVADSLRWDVRLEYVKRDVYHYLYHYDSAHGGEY
jgi:hypothetical protein